MKNLKKINIDNLQVKTYTIRSIEFDNNDIALIALEGIGLLTMNENFEVVNTLKSNANNLNSLSQKSIYEIFVDSDNTILAWAKRSWC